MSHATRLLLRAIASVILGWALFATIGLTLDWLSRTFTASDRIHSFLETALAAIGSFGFATVLIPIFIVGVFVALPLLPGPFKKSKPSNRA